MNKKIVSFAVGQMLKRKGIDEAFKCIIVLDCGKQFQSGKRIDNPYMWDSYITNKRSVPELAKQYKCSTITIRRRLELVVENFINTNPSSSVLLIDTTYFSAKLGVMLFQDSATGKILYRKYVKNETN